MKNKPRTRYASGACVSVKQLRPLQYRDSDIERVSQRKGFIGCHMGACGLVQAVNQGQHDAIGSLLLDEIHSDVRVFVVDAYLGDEVGMDGASMLVVRRAVERTLLARLGDRLSNHRSDSLIEVASLAEDRL
ncbi:hypothetical protein [Actinoplanes sp. TFC3]|uniref:hypothetical protein n=1 Tax=Actinoplanes sp. TFC3 TaxID=1710355 RepID=UPI00083101D7|nr:hypothetical protein [Actinoplanes sp. TFC3]